MHNLSICIPNYNGVNKLKKYLPSLFCELKYFNGGYKVIIIDDASKDNSI